MGQLWNLGLGFETFLEAALTIPSSCRGQEPTEREETESLDLIAKKYEVHSSLSLFRPRPDGIWTFALTLLLCELAVSFLDPFLLLLLVHFLPFKFLILYALFSVCVMCASLCRGHSSVSFLKCFSPYILNQGLSLAWNSSSLRDLYTSTCSRIIRTCATTPSFEKPGF